MRGGDHTSPLSGLGLRRDHGCMHDLQWRLDLPPGLGTEGLERRLAGHGFVAKAPGPGVLVFDGCSGHVLVIVPRTGRVQIRVDCGVPRERRPRVAAELAQMLAAARIDA
ncbi:MAG: hypothetical protein KC501_02970 [Myxococcales bacterium]|nr:hypothetical protein [Myxococcales bacterium]